MGMEISDRQVTQDFTNNTRPASEKQGNDINVEDVFKETSENGKDNSTLNLLRSAGLGAALGLGLSNRSRINEIEKKIGKSNDNNDKKSEAAVKEDKSEAKGSSIGSRLFEDKSSMVMGGVVGLMVGGMFGDLKVKSEINKLPTTTVEVPAHDEPVYDNKWVGVKAWLNPDERTVYYTEAGKDFAGATSSITWEEKIANSPLSSECEYEKVFANFPVKNADGTVLMQETPATKVTDHGVGSVITENTSIEEPVSITPEQISKHFFSFDIKYGKIGEYTDYKAEFDTSAVDRSKIMATYMLGGLVIGAAGFALTSAALNG